MHSRGIAHRDIKLENILLDEKKNAMIADFGFATNQTHSMEIAGTASYALPEMGYEALNTKQADIWATTVVLFTLYAGHPPFGAPTADDPYFKLIALGKWNIFWKAHSRNKPSEGYF